MAKKTRREHYRKTNDNVSKIGGNDRIKTEDKPVYYLSERTENESDLEKDDREKINYNYIDQNNNPVTKEGFNQQEIKVLKLYTNFSNSNINDGYLIPGKLLEDLNQIGIITTGGLDDEMLPYYRDQMILNAIIEIYSDIPDPELLELYAEKIKMLNNSRDLMIRNIEYSTDVNPIHVELVINQNIRELNYT